MVRTEVTKPADEVAGEVVAAALLANEGAIRFEVIQEKVFFGLFTKPTLWVVRDNSHRWPAGSLEYSLDKYIPRGTVRRVSDIISAWLGEDSPNPRGAELRWLMEQMANRHLLDREVIEKRVLGFIPVTTRRYLLPERTLALLSQQPAEEGQRLLETYWRARPEVFDLLMEEIRRAFASRTESSD